jgi:hypothetical protein
MATETQSTGSLTLDLDSLTPVHWLGVVCALVSGAVHLFLAPNVIGFSTGLAVSFALAGLGFLGAVVLLVLGVRRRLLYLVGVPFTAIQIAVWWQVQVASRGLFNLGTLDYVDKAAQVVLILVLVYLIRTER